MSVYDPCGREHGLIMLNNYSERCAETGDIYACRKKRDLQASIDQNCKNMMGTSFWDNGGPGLTVSKFCKSNASTEVVGT